MISISLSNGKGEWQKVDERDNFFTNTKVTTFRKTMKMIDYFLYDSITYRYMYNDIEYLLI